MCGLSIVLPPAFSQTSLPKGVGISSLLGNSYEVVNSVAIAEGDIIMGNLADMLQQRGLGLNDSTGLWPNGLVPYQIANDLSEKAVVAIQEAIDHWNLASSITLVERSLLSGATGKDAPANFIDFVVGPGCASWVGMQGGRQAIWIANYCTSGSVMHEIGHALGLLHEHTRADRDQFINVQHDNVAVGKEFNFDTLEGNTHELGAYDYSSIMHYGEYFFSSNGEPTIVPIGAPEGTVIGQRVAASDGDLEAIDRLYGTDLDIAVQGEVVPGGNSTELLVYVSNNGAIGAHDLRVSIPRRFELLNDFSLAVDSSSGWACSQGTNTLDCSALKLDAGETSMLALNVVGQIQAAELEPTISSKTHDTNPSNNDAGASGGTSTELEVGQAKADQKLSSGGGGSAGILLLSLMGVQRLKRQRATVITS